MREISIEDLVRSTRNERIRDKEIRERGLIKVFHGYYLPASLVNPAAPPWVKKRVFSRARTIARIDSLGTTNPGFATMESALVMWGLDTWSAATDVHYWRANRVAAAPMPFPTATVHGTRIEAATSFEMTGVRVPNAHGVPCVQPGPIHSPELLLPARLAAQSNPPAVSRQAAPPDLIGSSQVPPSFDHAESMVGGIRTVSLEEASVDFIRFSHPLVAYSNVSNVLRHLCEYNPWRKQLSLHRAETIRDTILASFHQAPGRHPKRSLALIRAADPGAASPGEALIQWLLHVMLRGDDRPIARFESQYEVIAGGSQYFLDVAFPEIGLGLEFDGLGKMNLEGAENDFRRRQANLSRAGWALRHFPSEDSRAPEQLARMLSQDLVSFGLKPQSLGGPLWQPVPPKLLLAGRSNGTFVR